MTWGADFSVLSGAETCFFSPLSGGLEPSHLVGEISGLVFPPILQRLALNAGRSTEHVGGLVCLTYPSSECLSAVAEPLRQTTVCSFFHLQELSVSQVLLAMLGVF